MFDPRLFALLFPEDSPEWSSGLENPPVSPGSKSKRSRKSKKKTKESEVEEVAIESLPEGTVLIPSRQMIESKASLIIEDEPVLFILRDFLEQLPGVIAVQIFVHESILSSTNGADLYEDGIIFKIYWGFRFKGISLNLLRQISGHFGLSQYSLIVHALIHEFCHCLDIYASTIMQKYGFNRPEFRQILEDNVATEEEYEDYLQFCRSVVDLHDFFWRMRSPLTLYGNAQRIKCYDVFSRDPSMDLKRCLDTAKKEDMIEFMAHYFGFMLRKEEEAYQRWPEMSKFDFFDPAKALIYSIYDFVLNKQGILI